MSNVLKRLEKLEAQFAFMQEETRSTRAKDMAKAQGFTLGVPTQDGDYELFLLDKSGNTYTQIRERFVIPVWPIWGSPVDSIWPKTIGYKKITITRK